MTQSDTHNISDNNKVKEKKWRGNPTPEYLLEQRQMIIDKWVVNGLSLAEIRAALEQFRKDPKNTINMEFDDRTLQRYIAKAKKELSEALFPKKKYLANRRLQRMDNLFKQALKNKDIKAAIMADDRIAEMFGLKNLE